MWVRFAEMVVMHIFLHRQLLFQRVAHQWPQIAPGVFNGNLLANFLVVIGRRNAARWLTMHCMPILHSQDGPAQHLAAVTDMLHDLGVDDV